MAEAPQKDSRTPWSVHEKGYLESGQCSLLVHHNDYAIGMQGGVEIIQHDTRLATNGFLFVARDGGRTSFYPKLIERTVSDGGVRARCQIAEPELEYEVRLTPEGNQVRLTVHLEQSLRASGVESGWFSFRLFPPALWGKAFASEQRQAVFPRVFQSSIISDATGGHVTKPLGSGRNLQIAFDDPELRFSASVARGELELIDGRFRDDSEWFWLRAMIDAGAKGEVLSLVLEPARIEGWRKRPVLGVSQVGYHPDQRKHAIIELSAGSSSDGKARLVRHEPDGRQTIAREATPARWGSWMRYEYAVFDFSSVTEAAVYTLEYEGERAGPFRIATDVFSEGVWQPTLGCFFPAQMCHMHVWESHRLWHAACHLDDAMQVPSPTEHFDGYRQGESSDSPFEPYQHIPHLDRGGWHDAGDTDLAAGAQAATTYTLALARADLGVDTDQTRIDFKARRVEISRPDGVPDIVQQIAHGVDCLLGGYRAGAGHSFTGIIESTYQQYAQRGELSTMTDNRIYDPTLGEADVQGARSGLRDDRFAFTNRDTALEYQVIAALAAASRTLKGHFDALADEALATALAAWIAERGQPPQRHRMTYIPGHAEIEALRATVELYLATGEPRFADALPEFAELVLDKPIDAGWLASRVPASLFGADFGDRFRAALQQHVEKLEGTFEENPYGVDWQPHVWGVGWHLQDVGVRLYYLHKAFPELVDREALFRIVHFVLGCHPGGNNASFTSGVGASSLTVAFGTNRSEFSHIPGGNVSGTALIAPDFPELKLGFPFLWQQSEYVMHGAATYLFCARATEVLLAGGGATT